MADGSPPAGPAAVAAVRLAARRPSSARGEPGMHTEAAAPAHAQTSRHVLLDTFRDEVEGSPLLHLRFHSHEVDPWRLQFQQIQRAWEAETEGIAAAEQAAGAMVAAVAADDVRVATKLGPQHTDLVAPGKRDVLQLLAGLDLDLAGLVRPETFVEPAPTKRALPPRPDPRPSYTLPTKSSNQHLTQTAGIGREDPAAWATATAPATTNSRRKPESFQRSHRFAATSEARTTMSRHTAPTQQPRLKPEVRSQAQTHRSLRSLNGMQETVRSTRGETVLAETFRAEPRELAFGPFEAGRTYRRTILLRNMTATTRRVRIDEPAHPAFHFASISFPAAATPEARGAGDAMTATARRRRVGAATGRVASGLAVECVVVFKPTARTDFHGLVSVTPEAGVKFTVPLVASANPPRITLPAEFVLPACLPGGASSSPLSVGNSGGAGLFRWCPAAGAPTTDEGRAAFWAQPAGDLATGGLFSVKPAELALSAGKAATVRVSFQPGAEIATASSDWLLVSQATGEATPLRVVASCQVPQLAVALGPSSEVASLDPEGQAEVEHPPVNPGCSSSLEAVVRNQGQVPCTFDLELASEESVFRIRSPAPPHTIAPNEACTVVFEFEPRQAGQHRAVCRLVRDGQPLHRMTLVGHCTAFQAAIAPQAALVDGDIPLHATYRRRLTLANRSPGPIAFAWGSQTLAAAQLRVEPSAGTVAGGAELMLELVVTPRQPGPFEAKLRCAIELGPTLTLPVHGVIQAPSVLLEHAVYDFGLVELGAEAARRITFTNQSELPVAFHFRALGAALRFSPACGQLPPRGTASVEATLGAGQGVGRIEDAYIECCVGGGPTSVARVVGRVDEPRACFSECQLRFDEVFAAVPCTQRVELRNLGDVPCRFELDAAPVIVEGDGDHPADVAFEPRVGQLAGRGSAQIEVTLTAPAPGDVGRRVFLCRLTSSTGSQVTIVPLAVSGRVHGVSLELHGEDGLPRLDFGTVPVREPATRTLTITNGSGAPADVSFEVLGFPAAEGAPPPPGSSRARRPRGQRVAVQPRADPAAVVRRGMGAAFRPTRPAVQVAAFSTATVDVECHSDLWGEYRDVLCCRVAGDAQPTLVDLRARVEGSPLVPQLGGPGAGAGSPSPVVRFPCVPVSPGGDVPEALRPASTVGRRTVRLRNASSRDVLVQWEALSVLESDNSLVDLLATVTEDGVETRLRAHEGLASPGPFSVLSEPAVIPAQQVRAVELAFSAATPGAHRGFVRGLVSLATPAVSPTVGDRAVAAERVGACRDWAEAESMAAVLFVSGQAVAPTLATDLGADGAAVLELTCTLADLLRPGKGAVVGGSPGATLVLRNETKACLTFRPEVGLPCLVSGGGGGGGGGVAYTLKPRETVRLGVSLVPEPETLAGFVQARGRCVLDTTLRLGFDNGAEQLVPVRAIVLLPVVGLPGLGAPASVDFGACPLGVEAVRDVVVENRGLSAVTWAVALTERAAADVDVVGSDSGGASAEESLAAFSCSCGGPASGTLDAFETKVSEHRAVLRVAFRPPHALAYACDLVVRLGCGLPSLRIPLCGRGSMTRDV